MDCPAIAFLPNHPYSGKHLPYLQSTLANEEKLGKTLRESLETLKTTTLRRARPGGQTQKKPGILPGF